MFFKNSYVLRAVFLMCMIAAVCRCQIEKLTGEAEELTITADSIQHEQETGFAKAVGNVKMVYGRITLTAREATLHSETMDFTAHGDVAVRLEDGSEWKSPYVKGNLETKQFTVGPYRLDSSVWHSGGNGGNGDELGNTVLSNAWLSTCECQKPHYALAASSVNYKNDKTFTAKNVVLKFGKIPVFYFPVLWGNLDGGSGIIFRPGYSGKKGAYLRLGRYWKPDGKTDTSLYMDLMSKRGIALGGEALRISESSVLDAKLYGLLDQDAPSTDRGYNRRFKEIEERFRVNTYYSDKLTDKLTLRINIDYMSDIDMLEDWYRREYRRQPQSRSYFDITYDGGLFTAGLGMRPRINDFYTVVETLPEFRFDMHRQNLGNSPFQYESLSRAGYYSMKWRNFSRSRLKMLSGAFYVPELHTDPADYSSARFHTKHFLYMPLELFESAVFTPRAGFAATYYSKSSKRRISVGDLANVLEADNPDRPYSKSPVFSYDNDGGDMVRLAFETGAELKTRFYSDWFDVKNETLNWDGLRHIAEPYINYTYLHEPTKNRDYIYYFDDIDRLEGQHFIRLGLDQRMLTRSGETVKPVLSLQSYVDFHFNRGEETDRHPGEVANRLIFAPGDSISYWAALVHDIGDGEIQRGEAGTRLGRKDDVNFTLRYIYRNEHISRSVYSMGSTLADFTGESSFLKKRFESADVVNAEFSIPVNSLTSFTASAEYDFEKNKVSQHFYEVRRQLHCWIGAFGLGWDNGDFELMLMFQLAAFPKVKMDLNF